MNQKGSKNIIIAIDPGLAGALSFLDLSTGQATIYDLPVETRETYNGKRKRSYKVKELVKLLRDRRHDVRLVVIEQSQPHPHDGRTSSFSNGHNFGLLLGIVYTLRLPHTITKPQHWKQMMNLNADKEESRRRARLAFPELDQFLNRKKDHNRSESLLLALFAKDNLLDQTRSLNFLSADRVQTSKPRSGKRKSQQREVTQTALMIRVEDAITAHSKSV